jgi:hypothetical protein
MHTKLDGAAKAVKYAVDLERAGRDFGRAKSLVLLRYFESIVPFPPGVALFGVGWSFPVVGQQVLV